MNLKTAINLKSGRPLQNFYCSPVNFFVLCPSGYGTHVNDDHVRSGKEISHSLYLLLTNSSTQFNGSSRKPIGDELPWVSTKQFPVTETERELSSTILTN